MTFAVYSFTEDDNGGGVEEDEGFYPLSEKNEEEVGKSFYS